MKTQALLSLSLLLTFAGSVKADPQISSWFTGFSGKYARIYTTDAGRVAGTTYSTWTNGRLTQSLPVYAGVQSVSYSSSWVYIKTPDLAPYTMGPWYNDATRTTAFVNLPVNQNITCRIPRSSTLATPPTTKTNTQGNSEDSIGYFLDGVVIFDPMDGFTYANGTEASPGTGQWHRDAYMNEAITFDPGNSHQQNVGKYHNHANPLALRHLAGDHVDYDSSTRLYSESAATPTAHSPILGWMRDGYPVYGPYGYATAMDATSGIRRMVGGFVLRNGSTTGVDNLTTTGRTALPTWATRNNGGIAASGPAVSTTYPLGRYIEDWAYLGDLVKTGSTKYQQGTDFDLNEYNVRYCVTPEFPNGTYAYFMSLSADGTPAFPYTANHYFFGSPTGGAVTSVTETVTTQFAGGPSLTEKASMSGVDAATGDTTIVWNSVEGGTYKVEATHDFSTWSTLSTTQAAASNAVQTSYIESGAAAATTERFYKVTRTALATYDTGTSSGTGTSTQGISTISPTSGTHGTSVSLSITLNNAYNPAPPPNANGPTAVTLTLTGATTITATSYSRDSGTGVVTANFTIPSGATHGAYTVNATFGPNTWSLTSGFTVN